MLAVFLIVLLLSSANSSSSNSSCIAPKLKQDVGCYDLQSLILYGISSIESLVNSTNPSTAYYFEKAQPILDLAVQASHSTLLYQYAVASILNTGFCLQRGYGAEFLNKSKGAALMADYKCSLLPLVSQDEYMVFSIGIATDILLPLCPGAVSLNQLATLCIAFSTCGGLPTVAVLIDKNFISCSAGNIISVAVSGSTSESVALISEFGLGFVGAGESLTGDLAIPVFKVWNFTNELTLPISGNFYETLRVDVDFLANALQLPKDILALDGTEQVLLHFAEPISKDLQEQITYYPQKTFNSTSIYNNNLPSFQLAAIIDVTLTIKISNLVSALPNMPDIEIAGMNMLVSTIPMNSYGIRRGFYLYAESSDLVKTALTSLLTYVNKAIGFALDLMLPTGMKMADMLKSVNQIQSAGFTFALVFDGDYFGFLIKVPLIALSNAFTLECRIDYLKTSSISCSFDMSGLLNFLTIAKNDLVWVVKEGFDFFDTEGNVIAAIAVEDFEEAGIWTKKAIETTAAKILNGSLIVNNDLNLFAIKYLIPCASFITNSVLCGMKTIVNEAECGTQIVANAGICGLKTVADGASCGVTTVTNSLICGTETGANGLMCGTSYVTDALLCGTSTVSSALLCGVDWLANVLTGHFNKTCVIANSCTFPNTCTFPKSCQTVNTCTVPAKCAIPRACNVTLSCWSATNSSTCASTESVVTHDVANYPSSENVTYSFSLNITLVNITEINPQMLEDVANATATLLKVDISHISVQQSYAFDVIALNVNNLPSQFTAHAIQNILERGVNSNNALFNLLTYYDSMVFLTSVKSQEGFVSFVNLDSANIPTVSTNAPNVVNGNGNNSPQATNNTMFIIIGSLGGVFLYIIAVLLVIVYRRRQKAEIPLLGSVNLIHNPLNDLTDKQKANKILIGNVEKGDKEDEEM